MIEQPVLSLAIVNWNTRELLLKCLAALRQSQALIALDVIVVDNASADDSVAAVQQAYPEVLLIANSENRGFAAASNQALGYARAPFWGLLNPDTEVRPEALWLLVEELRQHPDVIAAGPKLLNSDFSLQPSGRRFPTLGRTFLQGVLPGFVKRSAWWERYVFGRTDFNRAADVEELSGACFITRREAFARIGLLDEQFYIYFEEVDWFKRLQVVGQKVRYQPQAQVIHHWGKSIKQIKHNGIRLHYASEFKYWRKHQGWFGEGMARLIAVVHAAFWFLRHLLILGKTEDRDEYWKIIQWALTKQA